MKKPNKRLGSFPLLRWRIDWTTLGFSFWGKRLDFSIRVFQLGSLRRAEIAPAVAESSGEERFERVLMYR